MLAVLAYHLGWLPGGFLGVSLFFTLSGFLITNLLLREVDSSGRVRLRSFWARRARRLLPAALAGIALSVAVTAVAGTPDQLRGLAGDVIGALGYAANWRFVLAHNSYRAGFAAPSPLLHYWSLAVEEQLYLVVPLIVVFTARKRASRRGLAAAIATLMIVSAASTLWLGSANPDRIYFGTDTRMFELLAGALLAVAAGFPARAGDRPRLERWAGWWGIIAGGAIALLWLGAHQGDAWLYQGGLWAVAALSCALIAGACWGRRLGAALSAGPLAAVGRISYGIYVYHWPLFLALDPARTGLQGIALATIRLVATMGIAIASYRWLELPIRQGRSPLGPARRAAIAVVISALAIAAVVVAGLAGSRSIAATTRHPLVLAAGPPTPAPTAASAPALSRVLFMGDSLVQQAFPTFSARLRRLGIESMVTGGSGQSLMTHGGAWLGQLRGAVKAFDPDMVVLESCCGQFRFDAPMVSPDGHAIAPGSPEFMAAWRTLALQASRIASDQGARVMWVLGPPTHTNGWYGAIDGQIAGINAVYRSLIACAPGTAAIDWSKVGGPGGAYADTLSDTAGHIVQVRQSDGFHFTAAGIDALSGVTLPAMTQTWAATGRGGPWPDSCP